MTKMPRSRTLGCLLEELAACAGDHDALISDYGRFSYRDLHIEVSRLALGLVSLGLKRGEKVAILMGNRPEWIIGAFAVMSVGAVAVGLNSWATESELEYLVDHSDSRYIIATPTFLKKDYGDCLRRLHESNDMCMSLEGVFGVGDLPLPDGWMPLPAPKFNSASRDLFSSICASVSECDLALLLYTSGSTSKPKGVQLLHGSLIENPWNIGERLGVNESDRLWLAVSLFWGLGSVNGLMNLVTHRGCIVLQESFNASDALELIDSEKCTVFYGTPNMAQALYEHSDRAKYDLSSLRTGVSIGSPQQIQRVADLGVSKICNVYGLTETYGNSHVTYFKDDLSLRLHSCGKPLPGVQHRIILSSGQEAEVGEVGEIRLKGHITTGYYKDPIQTKDAFDESGFFRTGDLGCVDGDGNLFFRGRTKEMVKTGGINVSPIEVETVLAEHPDIYLAYVVGLPDERRDEVLAAVVVPVQGRTVSVEEVIEHCASRSAAYKVPRHVRIVSEAELPLTTTGKIKKQRISDVFFARNRV